MEEKVYREVETSFDAADRCGTQEDRSGSVALNSNRALFQPAAVCTFIRSAATDRQLFKPKALNLIYEEL
jgi:hypothetical protein